MKIKKLALVLGCAALLCGCTKSNIVQPDETQGPDFNMYMDIVLDNEQLIEDVNDIYTDERDYPMASGIDVTLDLDHELVEITVVVKDGTSKEDAAAYAMTAIKGVNDQVAVQDFSYGESGADTYGGLFQDNAINVKVYEESEYEADGTPMYEGHIPMDTYQEIVIE